MLDGSRRALLVADPALQLLNSWLSSWRGIGLVATGSAFEATPFRAVQVAAWETLART